MAQGFWALLIPHGRRGGALAHVSASAQQDGDGDGDVVMGSAGEEGWKDEYTQWWFEFLESSGAKGVSKDVWHMVSCRFLPLDGKRWDCALVSSWERMCWWGGADIVCPRSCAVPRVRADDRREVREVRPGRCVPPLPWHTSFRSRSSWEYVYVVFTSSMMTNSGVAIDNRRLCRIRAEQALWQGVVPPPPAQGVDAPLLLVRASSRVGMCG